MSVHWSVAITGVLLAVSLAENVLPAFAPNESSLVYAAAGVAGALLFLASVLAHEVGHAIVARRYHLTPTRIVLWVFGGLAELSGPSDSPEAEAAIAAAGPGASLLCATVAALFGWAALQVDLVVIAGVAWWLAFLNAALTVFNLLPGFPLDGGRVLLAAIWSRTGDRERAGRVVGVVGRAIGVVLVGLGIADLAGRTVVPWLSGPMAIITGWFLLGSAGAGGIGVVRTVADSMRALPPVVDAELRVSEFARRVAAYHPDALTFVVADGLGRSVGLVGRGHLTRVPIEKWDTTKVGDLMTSIAECGYATPDESLDEAVSRANGQPVLVFEAGQAVGVLV